MSISSFYKNKVAIVTGASMGIGKELARQILLAGGKVVITGRNIERLNTVKTQFESLSASVLIYAGDVTSYEENIQLIKKTVEYFGRLDVLINNAGLSSFGEIENTKPDVIKQVIDTNIYGSLFPTMVAIPELKKTRGSILFVSSVAAFHGLPAHAPYSISKLGLKALTQSLRTELESSGVFAGIAYVGFTNNEDDKKTLSPNGELAAVPARPKSLTASREETATRLLKQIVNRKANDTHGVLGWFTQFMSRYFPSVLHLLLRNNYRKGKG